MYNIYTVEPLYCGQHWDKYKCPDYRGVLISGVNLYYKAQFGTFVSVLNTGVSSIEGFTVYIIIVLTVMYYIASSSVYRVSHPLYESQLHLEQILLSKL